MFNLFISSFCKLWIWNWVNLQNAAVERSFFSHNSPTIGPRAGLREKGKLEQTFVKCKPCLLINLNKEKTFEKFYLIINRNFYQSAWVQYRWCCVQSWKHAPVLMLRRKWKMQNHTTSTMLVLWCKCDVSDSVSEAGL